MTLIAPIELNWSCNKTGHNQKVLQLLRRSKPYVRRNPTLNQVEIKGLTYRLLYSFELLFGRAQRDKLVRTFDFDGR